MSVDLPDRPPATERLVLRPWHEDDADVVRDMYSRPEILRFLGVPPVPADDRQGALERIARWQARTTGIHGLWAAVPIHGAFAGRVIGNLMMVPLPRSDEAPPTVTEIGWHVHPDAWGHGFATEGGRSLIERARAAGLDRVYAVVNPENHASLAVCDRLGMTRLGVTDEFYKQDLVLHAFDL